MTNEMLAGLLAATRESWELDRRRAELAQKIEQLTAELLANTAPRPKLKQRTRGGDKALRLIEAMAKVHKPLNLPELAAATALEYLQVRGTIAALVKKQMVRRLDDGRFELLDSAAAQ